MPTPNTLARRAITTEAFREIEREAEVDRWRSLAAYEAAKLTAKLEVALAEAATRGGEC